MSLAGALTPSGDHSIEYGEQMDPHMLLLIWKEEMRKDGPADHRGRLPAGTHVITIQAPTRHNPRWRLFGYLRWSEARTADHDTLEAAKAEAETWVANWMADLGVMPIPAPAPEQTF